MIRFDRICAFAALGPANLLRVAAYRIGLQTGVHPVLRLQAECSYGPFFVAPRTPAPVDAIARDTWRKWTIYFGAHRFPVNGPPDWHANPFRIGGRVDATQHWSRIRDFNPSIGDIKGIWEASRFDWLIAMAQRAALGNANELARLNEWLADWARSNPPYFGPNWKCGQEASIRVMHLAVSALLLGQLEKPVKGLVRLLEQHLARIAPTISYAIGQQNNHGTSEAAALYIGGSWLEHLGITVGTEWRKLGVRWLENRARALIEPDGTFSQYSVNYHRMMLDTYSLAEVWRRALSLPEFAVDTIERLAAASEWLRLLTDPVSGDAPNLGANDGARVIALTDTDYRDYRPSVQLAAAVFEGRRAYREPGLWDQPLIWLGAERPTEGPTALKSVSLDDGGLHILRNGPVLAVLRYPRFRFRPSQADALHLDLWIHGHNVLRDAGSYSYSSSSADTAYFNGTVSHNTVEFDGRDQMPRLGKFLFGRWLKARDVLYLANNSGTLTAAAGYRDYLGAIHHRQIWLSDGRLVCKDKLYGRAHYGVLRWRLMPGKWTLSGHDVTNGRIRMTVKANTLIQRVEISEGLEARYYLEKTPLPVLEVEVAVPTTLTTEITF